MEMEEDNWLVLVAFGIAMGIALVAALSVNV